MNEFSENGILVAPVRALTNYNYVLIKSNQIKSNQIKSNGAGFHQFPCKQLSVRGGALDEYLIIISKFNQNFIFLESPQRNFCCLWVIPLRLKQCRSNNNTQFDQKKNFFKFTILVI